MVGARNPLSPRAQEHAVPPEPLDATDCRILAVLQSNARIANVDLARAVHLSPSPCLRRVRRLEADGYIRDYVTLLDPAAIGLPVSRSEEHTSELQTLMRISYAVFCLKKQNNIIHPS